MSDEDDPMLKPDGHRYDAPEPRETTVNKEVAYAVLASSSRPASSSSGSSAPLAATARSLSSRFSTTR